MTTNMKEEGEGEKVYFNRQKDSTTREEGAGGWARKKGD